MNEPVPLICADCGYRLQGLSEDASCPECGSTHRAIDQRYAHKRSNLRYALAFSACGFLIYAVSAPFAALDLPDGPDFYNVNTWWLLLGWLAGAVFHLVAMQSYKSARIELTPAGKAGFAALTVVWFIAAITVLMLFSSAGQHGVVTPYGRDHTILGLAMMLSPTIPAATAIMPCILAWHTRRHSSAKASLVFMLTAIGYVLTAGCVVCLFGLVWLDWRVGIDLYLSSSTANNHTIEVLLLITVLGGGTTSVAGVWACLAAFRHLTA